jgi:stearoyl-CoA desaturase (delta-9 desaturase)
MVPASRPHIPNLAAVVLVHVVALVYAPRTFSLGALAVLVVTVYLTACVGWSVGVHRSIIHRSFECPRWLRYVLAYLSTLAGIGGPLYTYQSHNTRDYYQSLPNGPDISGYHRSFLYSYWSLLLRRPHPAAAQPVPDEVANDPVLRFLDRTNLLNQIPVVGLLYLIGGWDYVVWGGIMRIAVVFDLFASVNYFCHARGYRRFRIRGCTEEGRNNVVLGFIGMGEGWHNNHHAYPRSARMGMAWWELDLGYITIRLLQAAGLAWNVKTPHNTALRDSVTRVALRSTIANSR